MSHISNVVSIHPYFKVHPGKLDDFKKLIPLFVAKTQDESANLYYEFTINGDEIFCREGYVGAAGALAHLENVQELVQKALQCSDLIRVELHGPASELALLKAPLGPLKPAWFESIAGVKR